MAHQVAFSSTFGTHAGKTGNGVRLLGDLTRFEGAGLVSKKRQQDAQVLFFAVRVPIGDDGDLAKLGGSRPAG